MNVKVPGLEDSESMIAEVRIQHKYANVSKKPSYVPGKGNQVSGKWSWQKAEMEFSIQSGHLSRG